MGEGFAGDRAVKPQVMFRYRVRARMVQRMVQAHLGADRGLRILELGAADGRTLAEIRSLLPGGAYTGLEYSEELLARAAPTPEDTHLVRGDATDLPADLPGGGFDVVCALALLEHIDKPPRAVFQAA